jgi:hypothetical protein
MCAKKETIMRRGWDEIKACWRLLMRILLGFAWPTERYEMALCFHHDEKVHVVYGIDPATSDETGMVRGTISRGSWIKSELIDLGRSKMWRCTKCGQTWFLSEFDRRAVAGR